jgi:hypothetical protein
MATLKTLLLPALLALAPACDGLREFTITHPDELLSQADRSLATVLLVTWEADATPGMDVVFRLEGVSPEGVRHESERFPVDDGNAYWIIGDPTAVGLYRLHADVYDGSERLESFSDRQVILPGVEFRAPTHDFAGSSQDRDVWITSATIRPMLVGIQVYDDAGRSVGSLGMSVIASDLAPVGRVYTWNASLPAGTYALEAFVDSAQYSAGRIDDRSQVTWRPTE